MYTFPYSNADTNLVYCIVLLSSTFFENGSALVVSIVNAVHSVVETYMKVTVLYL